MGSTAVSGTSNAVDVVVVGGGNAGHCAALSARELGASVLLVERAPAKWRGGNTAFTGGSMRASYNSVEELLEIIPEMSEEELAATQFAVYPDSAFLDDLARLTEYRTDPDLAEVLVRRSMPTMKWMHSKGIRFIPQYGQYSYNVGGKARFFGGTVVEAVGGGPGLIEAESGQCQAAGVQTLHGTRAVRLLRDGSGIHGIEVETAGVRSTIPTSAAILACGGFEANLEWRTRYLGPGWDVAKVRGTRYNTGDGHRMAIEVGASPAGQWSGCHAVPYDLNGPDGGDNPQYIEFHKNSYPHGILVNSRGERFFDEGADFRPYTYARCGREVLAQPGQCAWQIFDSKTIDILGREYRVRQATKIVAETLEELASKLDGIDVPRFLLTVGEYNRSIDHSIPFNPTILDGRHTVGLAVPKSNWANTVDQAPFYAFPVTCGITFTFGGLRISPTSSRVLDDDGDAIPGLYAAGEIVGGLFYFNYPGGSGLTSGSVFGLQAGRSAVRDRLGAA